MAKLIKAFLHVAIKAPGLEAFKEACNFYENVLGLEPLSHWGEGLDTYQMYDFGNGGTIELSADGVPGEEPESIHHFALETDDVDLCVKKVTEAGYGVWLAPMDNVITSDPPVPVRMAFCIGPCGEKIEFMKYYLILLKEKRQ